MRNIFYAIILGLAVSCGNAFSDEDKPIAKESIPPINVDVKAREEGLKDEDMPLEAIEAGISAEGKMGKPEIPKKVEMDTNYDGRADRIEVYDSEGRVTRLDVDTDGDGIFEEWKIFEKGKPRIKGKDRNRDGRTDTWIEY